MLWLIHIVFFQTVWHPGQANSSCVWALCETVEQVPARWLFPLIITRRCFLLVCVLRNWIWQTSRCIAEIERDVVYSPQINPFVSPIVILSCLKMLPKLRWNACKSWNIWTKWSIKTFFSVWILTVLELAVDCQTFFTWEQHTSRTIIEAFLTST